MVAGGTDGLVLGGAGCLVTDSLVAGCLVTGSLGSLVVFAGSLDSLFTGSLVADGLLTGSLRSLFTGRLVVGGLGSSVMGRLVVSGADAGDSLGGLDAGDLGGAEIGGHRSSGANTTHPLTNLRNSCSGKRRCWRSEECRWSCKERRNERCWLNSHKWWWEKGWRERKRSPVSQDLGLLLNPRLEVGQ